MTLLGRPLDFFMAFFCLPRFAHFLRAIRQGMPTLQIDRTKPIELWPRHSQCLSKSSGALAIRLEVVSPLPKASDLSVPSAFDLHTQTHKEFFPVFLWRWVCDQHVRVSPKKLCDSRCPVGGRHARLSVRQCVCVCVCARAAPTSPPGRHTQRRGRQCRQKKKQKGNIWLKMLISKACH